jgi:hypothetical protein
MKFVIIAAISDVCPMDKSQLQNNLSMTADVLLYSEAYRIAEVDSDIQREMQNPKVIANVLSVIIKRIKSIDESHFSFELAEERKFYVDLFWHIANIYKIVNNH